MKFICMWKKNKWEAFIDIKQWSLNFSVDKNSLESRLHWRFLGLRHSDSGSVEESRYLHFKTNILEKFEAHFNKSYSKRVCFYFQLKTPFFFQAENL